MEAASKNKNRKSFNKKKPRRIKSADFAGTVKAFKNFDALAYQKSLREQ